MRGRRNSMSRSCCRCTTAGGWTRAVARYGQSGGQAISVNRLVPQQTVQMSRCTPGQARFAFRDEHSGHVDFISSNPDRSPVLLNIQCPTERA